MKSPTESFTLSTYFDCVVMLTWSNWHTEMRSNRYHYATRFAKHIPVIFVQPDLLEETFKYEITEVENIVILHIWHHYSLLQTELLNLALLERHLIKPLLWIYNPLFIDFIAHRYAPLKIYHATEDYFITEGKFFHLDENILNKFLETFKYINLLISVSDGVQNSYLNSTGYHGEHFVLPNGCDFNFWSENLSLTPAQNFKSTDTKIVLYQGNISSKINFDLLTKIVSGMPDWKFWFCGEVVQSENDWQSLYQHQNVKYFGKLRPEEVRDLAYKSSVGIIPFVESDLIIKSSFPLKAFEYVACGLPVVTVPIESLIQYPEVFTFAQSAHEFINSILYSSLSRYNSNFIKIRRNLARQQDYNKRFDILLSIINQYFISKKSNFLPLKVIILYDKNSIHVNTLKEHLESFLNFSKNYVFYAKSTQNEVCNVNLTFFDIVVIHYSVRVNIPDHLSVSYTNFLKKYGGFKILFIQDEYDTTEVARTWIENLGIHLVFTCVPNEYIETVYPSSRFYKVKFVQTLTGWVPLNLEKQITFKPISERNFMIGYRGRSLPYWYGQLGQEKLIIGKKMRKICDERGIIADIEWDDQKRIYSNKWYTFIGNCKATLGTESGSNVFDEDGEIRKNIEKALIENPSVNYEEIHAKYLAEHEGKVIMNQISPKIFEAIALRTALILFEGSYSDVIEPNIHYIPLKKDFSNVDEVLKKLENDTYIEELTNRAYQDIIESGNYSYNKFINDFDNLINTQICNSKQTPPLSLFSTEHFSLQLLELEKSKNNLEQSKNNLEQMEITIKAMKSSKFWKIRTQWLKLKKFLGLINDVG